MCGIIGYSGYRACLHVLLEGLEKLEYRGYDSAGVAVLAANGIQARKAQGRLSALEKLLETSPLPAADCGIGHTRWATHGAPSDRNSHPHCTPHLAVVHNGIVENYAALRTELKGQGVEFITETDTEVLAQQAIDYLKDYPGARVLDLCTGSGCVGLAIASQRTDCRVVLADCSEEALRVARTNARLNHLQSRIAVLQADALAPPGAKFDAFQCIVSNPPYIPTGDLAGLDPSVREYEPHLALDGGEDGLDFYRSISEQWRECLVPGGRLYFEVGIGQADAVLRIMRTQGFGDIQVVKDHQDIPRVVFGTLCTEV